MKYPTLGIKSGNILQWKEFDMRRCYFNVFLLLKIPGNLMIHNTKSKHYKMPASQKSYLLAVAVNIGEVQ